MDTQEEYEVVLEPQLDGTVTAYVPDLPGCVSEGATADEAVRMIGEAIALYLESRKAHNWPLLKVEHRRVAPAR